MGEFNRLESSVVDGAQAPVATVLIVTYNHARFLRQAIDSILSQDTDFSFEVIIGDDCSSDGTLELALSLQEANPGLIRLFPSSENMGLSANYARMIRAARGEFIAYCEGDDFWSRTDKLQRQVDYLRANSDTGAVHTDFDHIVWRNGVWVRHCNFLRDWSHGSRVEDGNILSSLIVRNFIQVCTLCFRTELALQCLEQGGLKDSYSVNDWPLCLYIAAHSKIAFFDESMAVYRKVPGSITNSGFAARVRFLRSQIDIIEDACELYGVNGSVRLLALSNIQRALISVALFADDELEFMRAHAWLSANAPDFSRSWRGRLLPWIAWSRLGRAIARRIQLFRVRYREATKYR